MRNVFEEMLRKTNEFKEEDIKESAKFVDGFCQLCKDVTAALPTYEQLNKARSIKRKEENE